MLSTNFKIAGAPTEEVARGVGCRLRQGRSPYQGGGGGRVLPEKLTRAKASLCLWPLLSEYFPWGWAPPGTNPGAISNKILPLQNCIKVVAESKTCCKFGLYLKKNVCTSRNKNMSLMLVCLRISEVRRIYDFIYRISKSANIFQNKEMTKSKINN